MNNIIYRHNTNSNKDIYNIRQAIKKGRARRDKLKLVCTVLGSFFMMAGIMSVIGICDYIGLGKITYPVSYFAVLGAFVLGFIGLYLGIKGCQG